MKLETKSRIVEEYGALSKELALALESMLPFGNKKATRPYKEKSPLAASLFEKKRLKKSVEDGFLSEKQAAAIIRLHAKASTLGKTKWQR